MTSTGDNKKKKRMKKNYFKKNTRSMKKNISLFSLFFIYKF